MNRDQAPGESFEDQLSPFASAPANSGQRRIPAWSDESPFVSEGLESEEEEWAGEVEEEGREYEAEELEDESYESIGEAEHECSGCGQNGEEEEEEVELERHLELEEAYEASPLAGSFAPESPVGEDLAYEEEQVYEQEGPVA